MTITVLAMSGGVDSSVAARLLLDQGHEVIGVFMRHGAQSPLASCTVPSSLPIVHPERLDHKQGCCSASDAEDARHIAESLGIPFYALNLQREFDRIIDYFVDEYHVGRTPNPCVMCNSWIKFGKLFDYADSLGAEYVATGHYARRVTTYDGRPCIARGIDAAKDQSYALFGVRADYVPRMLLPVGEFEKKEIRRRATEMGMRVAEKRDSQEICFVTSGKHGEFVAARTGNQTSGDIVTTDGTVVGSHEGYEAYTIGQRRGLAVAMGEPYFVVRIEPSSRRVVIGKHEELAVTRLTADRANWHWEFAESRFACGAQIRYNGVPHPAWVTRIDDDRFHVDFDTPCHGVAPGQAVVCYDGDTVVGGGWIASTEAPVAN